MASNRDQTEHKTWSVPIDDKGRVDTDKVHLVLLQDLRDHTKNLSALPAILVELQKLNALLHKPGLNSEMWGPSWLTAYIRNQQEAMESSVEKDD